MRPIVIALALLSLAPLAWAAPQANELLIGLGDVRIEIGQGCHGNGGCFPEEYAWVAAEACLPVAADAELIAERVVEDAPLALVPMEARTTGDPDCPVRATGVAEFWMGLVDTPLDCLRGSVVAQGVVRTRIACFSDL